MSYKKYTATSKQPKVINEFFKFALNRGVDLNRDDKRFLECLCTGLPESAIREALRGYIRVWLEHGKTDQEGQLNQNKGRFEANTFIRTFLGKPPDTQHVSGAKDMN